MKISRSFFARFYKKWINLRQTKSLFCTCRQIYFNSDFEWHCLQYWLHQRLRDLLLIAGFLVTHVFIDTGRICVKPIEKCFPVGCAPVVNCTLAVMQLTMSTRLCVQCAVGLWGIFRNLKRGDGASISFPSPPLHSPSFISIPFPSP